MDQIVPVSAPKAPALARRWLVVAVAVIATTAASLFAVRWLASAPAADGAVPTSPAIEAAWGSGSPTSRSPQTAASSRCASLSSTAIVRWR